MRQHEVIKLSIEMKTERVLWLLAIVCAVLLLFAPFTPRTTWFYDGPDPRRNPSTIRDSAGWDMVAPLSGLVAIIGLVVGVLSRRRIVIPSFCAVVATVAFAVTALAAGQYWMELSRGAGAMAQFVMKPAPGPPYFAVIATVATGFALLLTVTWLAPATDDW
jgi:hypothetical protein